MTAVGWLVGVLTAVAVLVAGDVASEEVRARLDRLPFALLRLARARLPAELRSRVHDQEWLPELEHILRHAELFPLTRLITGVRYAAGLLMRAGTVAAGLQPDAQAPAGEGRPRRQLAGRSARVLRTMIWPAGEPLGVRVYLAAATMTAAAAAAAAAATMSVHARDLELFAILLACILISHGMPSAPSTPLTMDLMDTWVLPTAVLLPPVFALITPALVIAAWHRRHPVGVVHRRVFSAAVVGLAYGAVSELAHAVALPAAGHVVPAGVSLLTWTAVIATCQLLAAALAYASLLAAIKTTIPAIRVMPLLANRAAARYHLAGLALGIAATFAAAANPPLAVTIVPAAILLGRHLRDRSPGPAPTQ